MDLLVSSTIKGPRARRISIHLPTHPQVVEPANPLIWFLGPPDADGRRSVVRSLALANEKKVRRRVSLWKKDGLICRLR